MEDAKKINKWGLYGRTFWIYVKYQIISKVLVGIIVLPLFGLFVDFMIKSSGRTNISSGDYLGFFMSLNGLSVIVLGVLLLVFVLGIDINTFIIISSLVQEGKLEMKIRNILWVSIKSIKYFFSPVGFFLVAFVAVVLPLLNIGISIGPFRNFRIPNFITSVIFSNRLYNILYSGLLIVLFIVSIIYIFTLHFVLIEGLSLKKALKSSRKLIQRHWKKFVFEYLWNIIKIFVAFVIIAGIILLALVLLSLLFGFLFSDKKVLLILLLISILELFSFLAFISGPIIISVLTKLFYKYNNLEGNRVHLKLENKSEMIQTEDLYRKIKLKTKIEISIVIVMIISFNFGIAFLSGNYFDEIFATDINIEIAAHRGGGDLGAENTVNGINEAIKNGVEWTEIDVQRTKDGKYIINHDGTFKRVAGVNKKPWEMTLAEIKKLRVKNEFYPEKPAQEIPTFEEILDASKGKIGIFVELKGKTADEKMVDDIVKMIKDRNMLDECVILSLDYRIIEYTEKNHPEIKTGFLYFFSAGKLRDLKGDYLIMEEGEATPDKVFEIHEAGKKAVVWTVNTPESIKKFIYSEVDGIITDHPVMIKEAISDSKNRTPAEIILDTFTAE